MENTNVKNQQTNEVEQTIKEEVEVMQQSTYNQLVAKLIKENKLYKNYKIKSCKCTVKDNYIQISFTLDKKIKGYLANDSGEFVQSETNLIFTSNFAISGAIKEDEDTAWLKNIIVDNPKVTELLLIGATIDIIQQEVAAGEEYHNPFSNYIDSITYFDHDTFINHIVNIRLSSRGKIIADKLMDKILDKAVSDKNTPIDIL